MKCPISIEMQDKCKKTAIVVSSIGAVSALVYVGYQAYRYLYKSSTCQSSCQSNGETIHTEESKESKEIKDCCNTNDSKKEEEPNLQPEL